MVASRAGAGIGIDRRVRGAECTGTSSTFGAAIQVIAAFRPSMTMPSRYNPAEDAGSSRRA